ncbi:unnamed protein product [Enterobius vermicularis]|uniref:VHL domain-containing protein n=1 Tax=Enterobius vermicularis TaxID=51028 RepID=A0A0N4VKN1_ENTVE|nr:unnamed protein product [Enterobius vermicularis]
MKELFGCAVVSWRWDFANSSLFHPDDLKRFWFEGREVRFACNSERGKADKDKSAGTRGREEYAKGKIAGCPYFALVKCCDPRTCVRFVVILYRRERIVVVTSMNWHHWPSFCRLLEVAPRVPSRSLRAVLL